ncbi:hypothetical protein EDB83DRAFT_2553577 [Lactarius deliciosus]|nr:hypothetical protein EDB83DRAFT_2553577 [Lactarius deliciosus]
MASERRWRMNEYISTTKVRLETDVVNPTKAVRIGTIPAAALVALWLLQLGSYREHTKKWYWGRMRRGVVDSLPSSLSLQPLESWIPGSRALKARAGEDEIETRSSGELIFRVPTTGHNFWDSHAEKEVEKLG